MATNLTLILSFLFLLLNFFHFTTSDDTCPYPCYPPPTGTGTGTPTTGTPPPPPAQSVSYPPPAGYYPSPSGNLPFYYSPPPPFGGSGPLFGPPPPDPILPYFPYYYREGLHGNGGPSLASSFPRSTFTVAIIAAAFHFCHLM